MKKIIVILFSLASIQCFGQVFGKKEVQEGIAKIETKQFSGTGGSGYWSLKYYDQKGRMIIEELYRKKTLMGKHEYKYDEHDNEILFISLYDINNPNKMDTVSNTKYVYNSSGLIEKEETITGNSTFTTTLISKGNKTTTYQRISQHYWKHKDTINFDTAVIKQSFDKQGGLIEQVKENIKAKSIEITEYSYYQNGKLKGKVTSRAPEPECSPLYVGGPGSDDMTFIYKYNRKGRIKVLFTIVEDRKYKLAKYKYEEW